uniref:uncharacterized protein LOC122594565 n=1 Tax=Erigeron canadensis TaxID=72917 RepID=UPI001CB95084|nr:uncharacterized protein LOC122594565 [Erigeron canadensis]
MKFNKPFGFLEILMKSITIVSRNGRLVAMVTSVYLIFFSFCFMLCIYIVRPMISDFITKAMELLSLDPQGLDFSQILVTILKDVKNFLGVQLAFGLAQVLVTLFAQSAIVLLTRVSYKDKRIFHKDLLKGLPLSSARLFMTLFHVTLMKMGFFLFGFIVLMAPAIMMSDNNYVLVILLMLFILLVSMYLSFSVVWVLSLVVSVLDECSGIEALGKAGRIVKGKRLDGSLLFLSIIFYHISSFMCHQS